MNSRKKGQSSKSKKLFKHQSRISHYNQQFKSLIVNNKKNTDVEKAMENYSRLMAASLLATEIEDQPWIQDSFESGTKFTFK